MPAVIRIVHCTPRRSIASEADAATQPPVGALGWRGVPGTNGGHRHTEIGGQSHWTRDPGRAIRPAPATGDRRVRRRERLPNHPRRPGWTVFAYPLEGLDRPRENRAECGFALSLKDRPRATRFTERRNDVLVDHRAQILELLRHPPHVALD